MITIAILFIVEVGRSLIKLLDKGTRCVTRWSLPLKYFIRDVV